MRAEEEFLIYLFPIPGSVSFPNTSVPLHVFEPRYRNLVKDALRDNVRIGVCHTEGVISPAKPHDSLEESLNSNQATYEPCPVFSAGFAEIIDTTSDGRLLTEIKMEARYEIVEEVQTIPYRIVKCVRYDDLGPESDERSEQTKNLRKQINENLMGMTDELRDELGNELTDEDYSFRIFQTIRFEPDLMQEVLEMRTPADRLRMLFEILSAEPTEDD